MCAKITNAADNASKATKALSDLLDTIRGMIAAVPSVQQYIQTICDAIALFFECVIAWLNEVYSLIPVLLYRLLSLFQLPQKIITMAIVNFTVVFSPPDASEPNQRPDMLQAQGAGNIFDTLVSTTGLLFLSRQPTSTELRHVNEQLKFNAMMRSEMKSMQEVLMTFVQNLPDVVKAWAQYVMPVKWWLHVFQPGSEYYNWRSEERRVGKEC